MVSSIVGAILFIIAVIALILAGYTHILLAILMIGFVIFFHEFGHFLFARINGVTVKEFSLGMGPRLCSFRLRGTKWSLKLLPFGGSCLMLGEDDLSEVTGEYPEEEEDEEEDDRAEAKDRSEDGSKKASEALPASADNASAEPENASASDDVSAESGNASAEPLNASASNGASASVTESVTENAADSEDASDADDTSASALLSADDGVDEKSKKRRAKDKELDAKTREMIRKLREESRSEGAFKNKSVWQRISIVFAGPFFNFLLAFIFACIIIGWIGYDPAYVMSVSESVQEQTGMQPGDMLLEYEGHAIRVGREMALYETLDDIPDEVTIRYEHNGEEYERTYKATLDERYLCGISYKIDETNPSKMRLDGVSGAASKAGLKVGDIVVNFEGVSIETSQDFQSYVSEHPMTDKTVRFIVDRDGHELAFDVTPEYSKNYSLGFGYNTDYRERIGALSVIRYGTVEVSYWMKATVKSLVYMIRGKASRQDVGGAVRVVSEMSNVVEESYEEDGAKYAFLNLINWAILLSANLGVMNLLPIPALDGGRLLFLIIEAIRGKKVNPKVEAYFTLVGFALLMILMVFILFNDISNIFGALMPAFLR